MSRGQEMSSRALRGRRRWKRIQMQRRPAEQCVLSCGSGVGCYRAGRVLGASHHYRHASLEVWTEPCSPGALKPWGFGALEWRRRQHVTHLDRRQQWNGVAHNLGQHFPRLGHFTNFRNL